MRDVVLGWERDEEVYIGIDGRRLDAGGTTHNASTFVSLAGIQQAPDANEVLILPRQTGLLGVEQVAYFAPDMLDEYLLNVDSIHDGLYTNALRRSRRRAVGPLSVSDEAAEGEVLILARAAASRVHPAPNAGDVDAIEQGRPRRRAAITPEAFDRVLQRAAENGRLGEAYIFAEEQTRLTRAGRLDLAEQVRWTARDSVSEGFDILSYEIDGEERFIEVKSTQGVGHSFPMTLNEWAVAGVQQERYVIARVTSVRERPEVRWLRNPVALQADGELQLDADGWRVSYE